MLLYVVQSVDILKYTDEEYEKYLTDPVGSMLTLLLSGLIASGIVKLVYHYVAKMDLNDILANNMTKALILT